MRPRIVGALLVVALATTAGATPRVAVLTMTPGPHLFERFGHTALLVGDRVYNFGTFFTVDTPYLALALQFWQRLTLQLKFAYEYRQFSPIDRRDHWMMAQPQLDIALKDWLYISLGYTLQYNKSVACNIPGLEPCNYVRNDVWLRLGVAY